MDISKKKVEKNLAWSPSTQKKLASMLGVSAVTVIASAALTACDTTSATSGQVVEPTSSEQMTCGEMPCDGDIRPESSSSEKGPNSSSLDPTSGISSSSMAPRPLSSNSEDPPITSGILPPSSSSYEIDTLEVTSGEVIPPEIVGPESGSNIDTGHLESSSSIAEPQSSDSIEIQPPDPLSGDVAEPEN